MKKPTFLLKPSAYKASKLYAILPDNGNGDGVVTGADADATRVNKDGYIEDNTINIPRIDYLGSPGLLLEPTRTNQFTQSETVSGQFTANGSVTITAADTISPDGSKTASKIADTSETTAGSISKTITVADGTAIHAFSFFVKFGDIYSTTYQVTGVASAQSATISISDDGSTSISSDVSSIISQVGSDNYGNGWYRFHCVIDMSNTDTGLTFQVDCSTDDVDREGYLWVWGFQLEDGGLRTSYIPTAATSVIRSQETVTFSTLITNGIIADSANGSYLFDIENESQLSDTTGLSCYVGNSLQGFRITGVSTSVANYPELEIYNADSTLSNYTLTSKRSRILFNLFGDNTEAWVNGEKVLTTSKDMSIAVDTMVLQSFIGSLKIREVAIFEKTLTDTESESITK